MLTFNRKLVPPSCHSLHPLCSYWREDNVPAAPVCVHKLINEVTWGWGSHSVWAEEQTGSPTQWWELIGGDSELIGWHDPGHCITGSLHHSPLSCHATSEWETRWRICTFNLSGKILSAWISVIVILKCQYLQYHSLQIVMFSILLLNTHSPSPTIIICSPQTAVPATLLF